MTAQWLVNPPHRWRRSMMNTVESWTNASSRAWTSLGGHPRPLRRGLWGAGTDTAKRCEKMRNLHECSHDMCHHGSRFLANVLIYFDSGYVYVCFVEHVWTICGILVHVYAAPCVYIYADSLNYSYPWDWWLIVSDHGLQRDQLSVVD